MSYVNHDRMVCGSKIDSPAGTDFRILRGMKYMTGYGRGERAQDGFKITVELGAVNRRQSEISVNLPRELEMLETPVRDLINRHVARGRVTARIGVHSGEGTT